MARIAASNRNTRAIGRDSVIVYLFIYYSKYLREERRSTSRSGDNDLANAVFFRKILKILGYPAIIIYFHTPHASASRPAVSYVSLTSKIPYTPWASFFLYYDCRIQYWHRHKPAEFCAKIS